MPLLAPPHRRPWQSAAFTHGWRSTLSINGQYVVSRTSRRFPEKIPDGGFGTHADAIYSSGKFRNCALEYVTSSRSFDFLRRALNHRWESHDDRKRHSGYLSSDSIFNTLRCVCEWSWDRSDDWKRKVFLKKNLVACDSRRDDGHSNVFSEKVYKRDRL